MLNVLRKIIPKPLLSAYHYCLAALGAIVYRFPTHEITVIGVTGTKGKTSTTELIYEFLSEAGHKVALSNTIHFKIGDEDDRNMFKMSMPGRMFLQRFFRKAVDAGCTHMVLELTSQGVLQHRQRFIELDALVFTNLSPEHIESHGSYENYRDAKLKLAKLLSVSSKNHTVMVVNKDDKEHTRFLEYDADQKLTFGLSELESYSTKGGSIEFSFHGKEFTSHLSGEFNIYNILGALVTAHAFGVKPEEIQNVLDRFTGIPGRLEKVEAGQDFPVIVDYAHTPDSLEKVYRVYEDVNKICILGNTGGGRDKWKRAEMARIAENHCSHIILTNEDPYDEDPVAIVEEMAHAIHIPKYEIEMDRRKAMNKAFQKAQDGEGDIVIITGKGTDPYIMGPNGDNILWDDATIAHEELASLLKKTENSK